MAGERRQHARAGAAAVGRGERGEKAVVTRRKRKEKRLLAIFLLNINSYKASRTYSPRRLDP